MSTMPEVLLERVVVNGFRKIRQDPKILDALFRHLSQVQLQQIKDYILTHSIDFSINFPREVVKAPAVVIVLKNETEAQTFLGDMMGDSSDPFVPDPDLSYDLLGTSVVSNTSGLPRKLATLAVAWSDADTVYFAEDQEDIVGSLQEDPPGSMTLHVISGTGVGSVYNVLRFRSDSLDIDGTFDPYLDDTSVVELRVAYDPELAVGEPSRSYDSDARNLVRLGMNYEASYQIHVFAGAQDEVIYLYTLLKAMFVSQRAFLEAQGLMALGIGGSDLAPRSEYVPSEVFQRVMTIKFVYPFSFLQEQEVFGNLAVGVTPADPGTMVPGETTILTTIKL